MLLVLHVNMPSFVSLIELLKSWTIFDHAFLLDFKEIHCKKIASFPKNCKSFAVQVQVLELQVKKRVLRQLEPGKKWEYGSWIWRTLSRICKMLFCLRPKKISK